MTTTGQEGDDIALAGEYALGLLEGAELADFEARLAREPRLAALVDEWNARLAPLADLTAPVAPPDRLRDAIAARIFGASEARGGVIRFRRRRWLIGTLAAAAAVVLALFLGPLLSQRAKYVAEVAAADRSLVIAARAEAGARGGEVVAELVAGAPAPERALELWLIPEGAERPIPLGLVAPGRPARADLPTDLAARLAGATLAVSEEPPGGSPTGQPTGPVVAVGTLAAPG
ncbi:MAG: anti-sigma factor [Roseovarius sp.]